MTLGNIIEFPNLESLHLFQLGHVLHSNKKKYAYMDLETRRKMQAEDERLLEDHKEYLIIWERFMPRLKEVRLVEDVVWVKREDEVPLRRSKGGCTSAGRARVRKLSRWDKVVLRKGY